MIDLDYEYEEYVRFCRSMGEIPFFTRKEYIKELCTHLNLCVKTRIDNKFKDMDK